MNYIEQLMKDNGIEKNEEFYIFDGDNRLGKSVETTFYFDEGLYLEEKVGDYHSACSAHLRGLITGEYRIEKIPQKPKSVWDLKEGDEYWYITLLGYVEEVSYQSDDEDIKIIKAGNAFLTREEAEFEVERRKCEAILLKYGTRDFMSLGNCSANKYNIYYSYNRNEIVINCNVYTNIQGTIYFESKELAQKAIEEVGEERLKKYVFNVKE